MPALLTDRYELTMVDAALRDGSAHRRCVFEVFARALPEGRRYGIVAGTGRLLEQIANFRFDPAELEWLRAEKVVGADTLDWFARYRFRGDVWGYREGEVYFPGSPILTVQGTFAEAILLETLILSTLNFDTAVASAASRMVSVALGRPLIEMGSRRTHEEAAVASARAAYIAGFEATSNLAAGRRWGIPTVGTAAHSFMLLHDSEAAAFRSQVAAAGADTTLLVDTYDTAAGVAQAIAVAGTGLGAVRIDSGDLPGEIARVRAQLDVLGAVNTKITVTSDLDEYLIAALSGAPVDHYGVGTAVVTGSGHPAAGLVYKLAAVQDTAGTWHPVAKTSIAKTTVGGRKVAWRVLDERGTAVAEEVRVLPQNADGADALAATASVAAAPDTSWRSLQVPLSVAGEPVASALGVDGVAAARAHRAASIQELSVTAFRLGRGEPEIPTRTAPLTSD